MVGYAWCVLGRTSFFLLTTGSVPQRNAQQGPYTPPGAHFMPLKHLPHTLTLCALVAPLIAAAKTFPGKPDCEGVKDPSESLACMAQHADCSTPEWLNSAQRSECDAKRAQASPDALRACVAKALPQLMGNRVDSARDIAAAVVYECRQHLQGFHADIYGDLSDDRRRLLRDVYEMQRAALIEQYSAAIVRKRAQGNSPLDNRPCSGIESIPSHHTDAATRG